MATGCGRRSWGSARGRRGKKDGGWSLGTPGEEVIPSEAKRKSWEKFRQGKEKPEKARVSSRDGPGSQMKQRRGNAGEKTLSERKKASTPALKGESKKSGDWSKEKHGLTETSREGRSAVRASHNQGRKK